MRVMYDVLRWVETGAWVILALAALNVWRQRRDNASRWLVLTFVSLASVLLFADFLPQDGATPPALVVKLLVGLIVLFPYMLYRFVCSFIEPRRWAWVTAHVLTGLVLVATAILPKFPEPGDPRTGWLTAYTVLFTAQWAFVLGRAGQRLLMGARKQPAVARRRMHTMCVGIFGFAAIILFSAFAPSSATPTVFQLATQAVGILLSPFFLLGFAPPGIVRMLWRRGEENELRLMEVGLARAVSRSEIAGGFLPAVVNLLGGQGAVLLGSDGEPIGRHLIADEDVARIKRELPAKADAYEPITVPGARALLLENGWLVVTMGPFTPFFGTDELQMLSASAVVVDLALGRAKLFELERQASEAMQEFVAIASHDLRTPVTVIQGFTQLLSDSWQDFADDKRQEFMAAIERQVVHLDRLVGDLLTVSKLDVNEVATFPQRIDTAAIIRQTIADIAPDAEIHFDGNGNSAVLADPEHFGRMLQNYIKNAVFYGATPINVELERTGDAVTMRIRDSGTGVPAEFVPRLFEKFARVDKKRSTASRGTGLGLSIVRGLARANGGDAWYEPNTPTGACFALRLPADRPGSNEMSHA